MTIKGVEGKGNTGGEGCNEFQNELQTNYAAEMSSSGDKLQGKQSGR